MSKMAVSFLFSRFQMKNSAFLYKTLFTRNILLYSLKLLLSRAFELGYEKMKRRKKQYIGSVLKPFNLRTPDILLVKTLDKR